MKLIIEIPEEDYNYAKQQVADGITNPLKIFLASGTPIPDNATFGDVIEKITNRKPLEDNKDADNIIISTKLWNAPYQKGGKE